MKKNNKRLSLVADKGISTRKTNLDENCQKEISESKALILPDLTWANSEPPLSKKPKITSSTERKFLFLVWSTEA